MKFKEAIVKRFMEICGEKGLAPNRLARESGVSPTTVYSMFRPDRLSVESSTVKKLCDGLNMSVRDFFNNDIFDDLEQEIE